MLIYFLNLSATEQINGQVRTELDQQKKQKQITFNVEGKIFILSEAQIMQFPDSKLAEYVKKKNNHEELPVDENGNISLNSEFDNQVAFKAMEDFLKNWESGTSNLSLYDFTSENIVPVYKAADYYGLRQMTKQLAHIDICITGPDKHGLIREHSRYTVRSFLEAMAPYLESLSYNMVHESEGKVDVFNGLTFPKLRSIELRCDEVTRSIGTETAFAFGEEKKTSLSGYVMSLDGFDKGTFPNLKEIDVSALSRWMKPYEAGPEIEKMLGAFSDIESLQVCVCGYCPELLYAISNLTELKSLRVNWEKWIIQDWEEGKEQFMQKKLSELPCTDDEHHNMNEAMALSYSAVDFMPTMSSMLKSLAPHLRALSIPMHEIALDVPQLDSLQYLCCRDQSISLEEVMRFLSKAPNLKIFDCEYNEFGKNYVGWKELMLHLQNLEVFSFAVKAYEDKDLEPKMQALTVLPKLREICVKNLTVRQISDDPKGIQTILEEMKNLTHLNLDLYLKGEDLTLFLKAFTEKNALQHINFIVNMDDREKNTHKIALEKAIKETGFPEHLKWRVQIDNGFLGSFRNSVRVNGTRDPEQLKADGFSLLPSSPYSSGQLLRGN